MRHITWLALAIALLPVPTVAAEAVEVPPPRAFFGFEPGSDGFLVDYAQLIAYLEAVDRASPRVELREVGRSPLGRPMHVAFISSPENIGRLDELKEVNRRLALSPDLEADERDRLLAVGRVFVMAALSMHSEEVGPTQAFPLLAWELATTSDPVVLARLAEVVLMVVPCHNPDGMDMVVEYYRRQLGTPYEGGDLPGVYHRYVGHDNNRDFVTLTQEDNRVVSRLYSTEWFPQVVVEKHQMGSSGPRYFVPSPHDPIAENVDEGIWTWGAVFGANLSRDMTAEGLSGVASHWLFDDYWPGSTTTSLWKGAVSFLTEAASCKGATPIFVEPTELRVSGKGLSEYKKSVNMPDPWPGGWWRLGDIVRYELASIRSILATAAASREALLAFRNDLCRAEVERGRSQPPYYYLLPLEQRQRGELVELVRLLDEHGVRVFELGSDQLVEGRAFRAGDLVIPLAQPFRAFVKEVMERQRYPVRHYTPGGEVIKPYDITSWSLPLHRGLDCLELDTRSTALEAALVEVSLPWRYPGAGAPLPDSAWGAAYPAGDTTTFAAAFAALGRGIEVRRLEAALTSQGVELPAGSFLLVASPSTRSALDELVASLPVPPVPLATAPEATARRVRVPRVGLVESWFHDMDAGWTRYLLDRYRLPYRVLRPGELGATDLAAEVDVLLFPDTSVEVLRKGQYKWGERYLPSEYPPEYRKPIGKKGMGRLLSFLDAGGVVVSWGRSTGLFLGPLELPRGRDDDQLAETFELPVRDLREELQKKGLEVPGSWLKVRLATDHPLAAGMPAETGVFSEGQAVLSTSLPILDMDRRVIAAHPEEGILLSGYAEKEELLGNTAAVVWVRKGKGQLVLFSFAPHFRASTPATYPLLFNALLLPRLE